MSVTTDFLQLTKPGGGSTGLITPPERVDIDVLNDNFQKIDDWAEKIGNEFNRSFAYYGPAANIGTVTPAPKDGDTYQESDGNKILWKRVGGVWVTFENGAYLLRPTSVTNGSVSADGSIIPSGSASSLGVNGIFTSRFRKYRIEFYTRVASATSHLLRMRNAGADIATASYASISTEGQGTTATVFSASSNTFWNANNANNTRIYGHVDITNPGTSGTDATVTYSGQWGGFPEVLSLAVREGYLSGSETNTYDGFSFTTSNGSLIIATSWFKVYAIA